ncbi:MAG: energy transducer TonB [Pyrinomonadaceae bacterium]
MTRLLVAATISILFSAGAFAQESRKPINGGIVNGKAQSIPKPEYPFDLKASGIQGIVKVGVTIDEAGDVISAEMVADPDRGPEAEAAYQLLFPYAKDAALKAKFAPTRLSGVPVQVQGIIVYNFVHSSDDAVAEKMPDVGAVNGGVLNGKALSLPKPVYPPAAKAVRARGAVSVRIVIDEEGRVIAATAVSGHPLLRAASVEAARGATFSPTKLSGEPVKVSGVMVYNFVSPDPTEQ